MPISTWHNVASVQRNDLVSREDFTSPVLADQLLKKRAPRRLRFARATAG